ncbi:MAG: glycosyltransferase [Calditrichia bacterium]
MFKKIIHTTISPCDNERRIFNEALTAARNGYQVQILALKTPDVPPVSLMETVEIQRLTIRFWQKGALKFLCFNQKLFWHLLRSDFSLLHAHDLWVLPASAIASILKRKPLIYDAHEFYRGLKIFREKKISALIWKMAEWLFIRRAGKILVVNQFHADLYKKTYQRIEPPLVIQNLPFRHESGNSESLPGFSERSATVVFQGILKPGRGLRQMIEAFDYLDDIAFELIGFGEIEEELRDLVEKGGRREKIHFRGKMNLREISHITQRARAGVVLFEPDSINYRYAAPNKFFEYVMAGTPVIASDIPTFRSFLEEFEVGVLVDPYSPEDIARAIRQVVTDENRWNRLHQACKQAREHWNWESQEKKLLSLYREICTQED